MGNKKNVDTKLSMNNNLNNQNTNNIFGGGSVLQANKIEIGRSGSVFTNNTNNEKLAHAQNVLKNEENKMNQKKNFGGLTSSIGLINRNSSIGQNQLQGYTMKIENFGSINPSNNNDKIESSINVSQNQVRKDSVFDRYKKRDDDIEEIVDSNLYSNVAYSEIKDTKKIENNPSNNVNQVEESTQKVATQDNNIGTNDNPIVQKAFEIKQESSNIITSSVKKNGPDESDPKTILYNMVLSKEVIPFNDLKAFLIT